VIRLEWVHAKAARDRWREEKLLLIEEGHRIAASFEANAKCWDANARQQVIDSLFTEPDVALGYQAHLFEQAFVYTRLAEHAKAAAQLLPPRRQPLLAARKQSPT